MSTRDVIFDEQTYFDDRSEALSPEMIAEMDNLMAHIKLPEA